MPWGIGSALLPFFFFFHFDFLFVCDSFAPKLKMSKNLPHPPPVSYYFHHYQLYAPPSDRFIVSMYSIPIFKVTGNAILPVLLT